MSTSTSRKELSGGRYLEKSCLVDGRPQRLPFSWLTAGSPFHHAPNLEAEIVEMTFGCPKYRGFPFISYLF